MGNSSSSSPKPNPNNKKQLKSVAGHFSPIFECKVEDKEAVKSFDFVPSAVRSPTIEGFTADKNPDSGYTNNYQSYLDQFSNASELCVTNRNNASKDQYGFNCTGDFIYHNQRQMSPTDCVTNKYSTSILIKKKSNPCLTSYKGSTGLLPDQLYPANNATIMRNIRRDLYDKKPEEKTLTSQK